MTNVIAALKADHVNMLQLLEILEANISALERGERPDYDILSAILEYCLNYPDLYHHPKEDSVFRALRARRPEVVQGMGNLEQQHDELSSLTRRLGASIRQILLEAELDRGAVVALAQEFIASYRHHIEMEEKWFFPAAENHLIAEDWSAIHRDLRVATDPIFDGVAAKDLQDLRERVLRWHRLGPAA